MRFRSIGRNPWALPWEKKRNRRIDEAAMEIARGLETADSNTEAPEPHEARLHPVTDLFEGRVKTRPLSYPSQQGRVEVMVVHQPDGDRSGHHPVLIVNEAASVWDASDVRRLMDSLPIRESAPGASEALSFALRKVRESQSPPGHRTETRKSSW